MSHKCSMKIRLELRDELKRKRLVQAEYMAKRAVFPLQYDHDNDYIMDCCPNQADCFQL